MKFFILAGFDFYPSTIYDFAATAATRTEVDLVVLDIRDKLRVDYITVFEIREDRPIQRFKMPTEKHPNVKPWTQVVG